MTYNETALKWLEYQDHPHPNDIKYKISISLGSNVVPNLNYECILHYCDIPGYENDQITAHAVYKCNAHLQNVLTVNQRRRGKPAGCIFVVGII